MHHLQIKIILKYNRKRQLFMFVLFLNDYVNMKQNYDQHVNAASLTNFL